MALIDRRDTAYRRWKRFRTDELKAICKSARSQVTKRINIEKILFYARKFASALDNRAKWMVIRDIGIGVKCHKTPDVYVNDLNHKFVNFNVPTPDSNIYNDLCFVPLENPFSF